MTAAILLALAALGWFFWLGPTVDAERERADKLAAEVASHLNKLEKATADFVTERKAHGRAKGDLTQEQDRREEAEGRATRAEQQLANEQIRLQDFKQHLNKVEAELRKAKLTADRTTRELEAARASIYPDRLALADFELRYKAPDRAANYLRTCAPGQRGWEWYYLNGQCDTEVFARGPLTGPALAVAYSPDGKRIAAGGMNRRIHIWDAATGREVCTTRALTGNVMSLAFSPDGERLASGTGIGVKVPGIGEVVVWDASSGKEVQKSAAPGIVTSVAFGPGGRLAASCLDGTICRWDTTGKELPPLKGHSTVVNAVAFSPDGALLAACDGAFDPKLVSPGLIKIWDLKEGRIVLTLKGHPAAVLTVAFADDGKRLVSSDAQGHLKFWAAAARGEAQALTTRRLAKGPIRVLAVCGKRLFTGMTFGPTKGPYYGVLQVLNAENGALLNSYRTAGGINALAPHPDGTRVVTAETDRRVRVRSITPREPFRTIEAHDGTVACLAFSQDGRLLASAAGDQVVHLWNAHTGRQVHPLGGVARPVAQLAFSADGKYLVTVGRPAEDANRAIQVLVWDTATGMKVGEVPGLWGESASAGFSPDGKRLLVAIPGKELLIWDLQKRQAVERLDDLADSPRANVEASRVAVSPDGNRIALAERTGLKVFQRVAGMIGDKWRVSQPLQAIPGLNGLVWGPRGAYLLVGSPSGVLVLDTSAGKVVGRWIATYPDARSMTVSVDGKRVFTGMGNKSAYVWEVVDSGKHRRLLALRGTAEEITCLIASPDGRRLAAGCTDGRLVLWDAAAAVAAGPAK